MPFLFHHFSNKGLLLLCLVNWVLPAYADDVARIDRLTQQWLDTDRQTSRLQSDWQQQRPVLEQRISLLKAEKAQLQEILKDSSESQNDVDGRRAELLAEQDLLEQQQKELKQALRVLLTRINEISTQLPPPLERVWQDEQGVLGEKPEVSMQLQVVIAQLSRLADFDQRISVYESPIVKPDGSEILVKQLYLGIGMAWFVSSDREFAGWGQVGDEGWQWHIDDSIDTAEIAKAIAIFEKRQQADFVRLPVKLADNVHRQNHQETTRMQMGSESKGKENAEVLQ